MAEKKGKSAAQSESARKSMAPVQNNGDQAEKLEVSESQLKEIVNNAVGAAISAAVKAATLQIEKDLRNIFDERCEHLESRIHDLEVKKDENDQEIDRMKQRLQEKNVEVNRLNQFTRYMEDMTNDLEQYSRKSCIRVFGVREETGEDCALKVSEIFEKI